MKNYSVYFSPTGGTKKVVEQIGKQFENVTEIDISMKITDYAMEKEDFCIVGVPSFGGRMPAAAVERLRKLQGNQTPALLVVTYGNRAYEDTLIELKDVLEAQGFVCIGAAAIVTEHSIVHEIAEGRPAEGHLRRIEAFAAEIRERLAGEHEAIEVPGNVPYKELHVVPMNVQATEKCMKCGVCAKKCPVGAIPAEDPSKTDSEKCISCMRCESICPAHARKCADEMLEKVSAKLNAACPVGKEDEFF